jgi:hypothetical protein
VYFGKKCRFFAHPAAFSAVLMFRFFDGVGVIVKQVFINSKSRKGTADGIGEKCTAQYAYGIAGSRIVCHLRFKCGSRREEGR